MSQFWYSRSILMRLLRWSIRWFLLILFYVSFLVCFGFVYLYIRNNELSSEIIHNEGYIYKQSISFEGKMQRNFIKYPEKYEVFNKIFDEKMDIVQNQINAEKISIKEELDRIKKQIKRITTIQMKNQKQSELNWDDLKINNINYIKKHSNKKFDDSTFKNVREFLYHLRSMEQDTLWSDWTINKFFDLNLKISDLDDNNNTKISNLYNKKMKRQIEICKELKIYNMINYSNMNGKYILLTSLHYGLPVWKKLTSETNEEVFYLYFDRHLPGHWILDHNVDALDGVQALSIVRREFLFNQENYRTRMPPMETNTYIENEWSLLEDESIKENGKLYCDHIALYDFDMLNHLIEVNI